MTRTNPYPNVWQAVWIMLGVLVALLLSWGSAHAQNPCTATKPPVTTVTSISEASAIISNYAQITDLDISVFPSGFVPQPGSAPILTRNVIKTGWSLVSGTTCYLTSLSFLTVLAPNIIYDLWIRANIGTAKGAWTGGSGPVPFQVQTATSTGCLYQNKPYKIGTQKLFKFSFDTAEVQVNALMTAGWFMENTRISTNWWYWTGVCRGV